MDLTLTTEFIAVIIAVVVPVIIYLKQRQRKELSYELVSATPILSHEDEIKGIFQITFEGKAIDQVYLVLLAVINSGNVPIRSDDYEREVSLSFGAKATPLMVEVLETYPDSLHIAVKIVDNKIVLDKALLNKRDLLRLKILVTGFEEVKPDGRIIGIEEIQKLHTPKLVRALDYLISWYYALVMFLVISTVQKMQTLLNEPLIIITQFCFNCVISLHVASYE